MTLKLVLRRKLTERERERLRQEARAAAKAGKGGKTGRAGKLVDESIGLTVSRVVRTDAENAKRAAALEASGKKATGGLHKFDASEVDVHGGDATADDFLDAFGF